MTRQFAIFDLDHTLLPFDTQALFCNFVLKREPWRVLGHAVFLPVALGHACRLIDAATTRRAFHAYLWRMPEARLRALAREFARTSVDHWIFPELRSEILRHRNENRVLVLNTASPDFYAREIAEALGFAHHVATRFVIGERVAFMPAIRRGHNEGKAKVAGMIADVPGLAEMTDAQRAQSWSYSDRAIDLPLLEFTGNPVVVHPTAALAETARERGWPVLKPARPYHTRLGGLLHGILQFFGLHPA